MNKRDQQKLKKEQKQQAAKRKEQTRALMFKVGMYGVAPLFVLLLLFTLFSQGPTYAPAEIADTDHIRGDASTPVTITVYADFQCPACAAEYQLMSRAWPSISDKAHMIFRHFPITDIHPNAWTASLYAEAAARQGRFWEMHDYLFVNQNLWGAMTNVEEEFENFALQLDMDIEQLQQDVRSDSVIEKVRSDERSGVRSGVRGTPTIFINGSLETFNTVTRLVDLVDTAYEEAAGS